MARGVREAQDSTSGDARTVRETEAKFRVNPTFELPSILGAVAAVTAVDAPTRISMNAVYYDTQDLRLAREGVTLRRRSGGSDAGWHLKLPVLSHTVPDGTGVRDEIQLPDSPAIPTELSRLITVWARTAPLRPVATLASERTTLILRGADGVGLAELVDDTVSVEGGSHNQARFRELEVEATGGDERIVADVAAVLRDAGAVGGEFVPKVVRALGPQATTPADPPPPLPVDARDPVSDLVAATLRGYTRLLMSYDVAVRRGLDDAVHQMRVATRRLRSALRSFEPLLDKEWADALATELHWLAGVLGAARDSEVLRTRLLVGARELPTEAKPAAVALKLAEICDKQCRAAFDEVYATLISDRYIALVEQLVDAATYPRTTDAARRPSSVVLPPAIRASWATMRRRATAVTRKGRGTPTPTQYHEVRIAAKHVRYLCDAAAPALGPKARKLGLQVARVQDVLGEQHDAVVAAEFLAGVAALPRIGSLGFGLGLLFAREEAAATAAARSFDVIWPDVIKAKRRRWLTN
ncbi:MAG TPA: CYTH and CHAD domain-containing protein [Acidothermaceae bacterium]